MVNEEQLSKLREFIDYLDAEMETRPTKELADLSNQLEEIYQVNYGKA